MGFLIDVRQNEMIIVAGESCSMTAAGKLFTVGLYTCVGLVLWSPEFCAASHIDTDVTVKGLLPVIKFFMTIKQSKPGSYAMIVMGKDARAETVKALEDALGQKQYDHAKTGLDHARFKIELSTGKLETEFDFETGMKMDRQKGSKAEWNDSWIGRPGSCADILIGVLQKVSEKPTISYFVDAKEALSCACLQKD